MLKPDQVLTRIFERLGLITDDKQLLKTVLQGQKFADAPQCSACEIRAHCRCEARCDPPREEQAWSEPAEFRRIGARRPV